MPPPVLESAGRAIAVDGPIIGPGTLCPKTCDDGNPCTTDRCFDGACENIANTAACEDGDPCTANVCSRGICQVVTTATCRGDQCNVSMCDGRGGCTTAPRTGALCNDGVACTYGETCDASGTCGGGKPIVCKSDACTDSVCNGTSTCKITFKTGTTCNDGNPCTHGDTCDGNGGCKAAGTVTCVDDACNTRRCDGSNACAVTPRVGSVCSDGNACTHGDVCDKEGTCRPTGTVTCASDVCNTRICNGTSACKVTPRTGNRCDDGELCSHNDVCNAQGTCGGTKITCASDETVNRACNGGPTCTVTPRPGAACDDGNACTHGDVRRGDGLCQGTPYTCEVGVCLVSSTCDGKGGCTSVSKPDETACDADSSQCTPHDVCRAGVCVPDPRPVRCVERDCNTVSCNPVSGNCEYQPTSGGTCGVSGCFSAGTCVDGTCSGQPKDCSAHGGPCMEGICDATTGACVGQPRANGTDCSPGGACSGGAACAFGVCELPPAACPAVSSACKVAACEPGNGRCIEVARPAGSPCDPKNSCLSEAVCDAQGACVGNPASNGDPCTAASGQIGQCVASVCVAGSPTTPPAPLPDAGAPIDAPSIGKAAPPAGPSSKGCTFSAGAPSGGLAWLWLVALAWLARRRR